MSKKFVLVIPLLAITTQVFSFSAKEHRHAVVQLGGYWSSQGKAQHINIDGLIGDDFTINNSNGSNGLVGLGYFIDGQEKKLFKMSYGVNAFYLPKTSVRGVIVQESIFTNLSYRYDVTHHPIYAVAKSTFKTKFPAYALTVDLGIGPNFLHTSQVHEQSLDGGITLKDHMFSGQTTTRFSAMAGIGIQLNNAFGLTPLECGYKFFYLGQGSFNKNNTQVLNNLNAGTSYANAIACAITV